MRRLVAMMPSASPSSNMSPYPPSLLLAVQTLSFIHATDRFFETVEPILRAPLPRVWSYVE